MGIFKPTKIEADIAVYSKWCLSCDDSTKAELLTLSIWANNHDLEVQVVRTIYSPADHRRATELWGSRTEAAEDYPAFVVYKDVMSLKEFVQMISMEECENKLVRGDKAKGVQGLPKAKGTARKNRMGSATTKSKTKVEE